MDDVEREQPGDLFGLGDSFPRPGWVVLDAAREDRFTGEIVFDTTPEVRVYFDRGRIYLAERVTDPPLGTRLVDAGAMSSVQLEQGSVRVGDAEHLGRLFERVPSIDRHAVLVTSEMMTEECVGWLAAQRVSGATAWPYRHHLSGMHRWEVVEIRETVTVEPLPAPAPDAEPVLLSGPTSLLGPDENFDDMIRWDDPGFLDDSPKQPVVSTGDGSSGAAGATPGSPTEPGAPVESSGTGAAPEVGPTGGDWIDRLESDGLPEPGSDPLASVKPLPTLPVEPVDRFEVIWPSGEIDESFGATQTAPSAGRLDPDHDRVGPTARVARPREMLVESRLSAEAVVAAAFEATAVLDPDGDDEDLFVGLDDLTDDVEAEPEVEAEIDATVDVAERSETDSTDEVVLAVRRAVASIDTGSLATRRRLAEVSKGSDSSRGVLGHNDLVLPGRIAVRTEQSDWIPSGTTRSVFDEPTAAPLPGPVSSAPAAVAVVERSLFEPDPPAGRTSALRRLIASLRRR